MGLIRSIVLALFALFISQAHAQTITRPLSSALGLNPYEISNSVNEKMALVASTTYDLLNISPGQPGYVSSIWMTFDNLNLGRDSIIKVFVDGEGSPSLTSDMGSFLNHWFQTQGKVSTAHVSTEIGSGTTGPTYTIKFPIPFKSSVHITLTTIAAESGNLWSIVDYTLGVKVPYKLLSSGVTYANRSQGVTPTNQGNRTIQFLNVSGTSGWVVWHSIVTAAATDFTYLENNIVAYLDGLTPGAGTFPQVDSSGSEDYFGGSFYWENIPSQNSWTAISTKGPAGNTGGINAGFDWLSYDGGLYFKTGCLLTWEVGQRTNHGTSDTNVDIAWLVLYYIPNP